MTVQEHSLAECQLIDMLESPQAGVLGVEADPGKVKYLVGSFTGSGRVEWELFDQGLNTTEPDNWPGTFVVLEVKAVVIDGEVEMGTRGRMG